LAFAWISPAFAAEIPAVSDADLEAALVLAGTNRSELQAALDTGIQKPYQMQALRFVVANLPLSDLGKITQRELVDHYELALQARQESLYGQQYDDAAWAHFVLPPRMSQEPLSNWRPELYKLLAPVVADARTLDEAALRVNAWCGSKVRFEQTQRRDQGPLVTLAGGYGRCEELVLLFVDACRSVGIPARQAYCPWWAVQDNNHAWAEVLGSDGKWHYTGGCEPADKLDKAWFGAAVKQAPIILSPCFGIPDDTSGMEVLRLEKTPGARYCLINNTASYRECGTLRVDTTSVPLDTTWTAHVSIFNYGALREIARFDIDRSSSKEVSLGTGDYVVTVNTSTSDETGDELSPDIIHNMAPLYGQLGPGPPGQSLMHIAAGQLTAFIVLGRDANRLGGEILLQFPPDPSKPAAGAGP
jgi:hypothetical protein